MNFLLPLVASTAIAPSATIHLAGDPFGVAWGILYGYQQAPAAPFLRELKKLGGGCTKIYVYWDQLEPTKGHYDWTATDAFVKQLGSPDDGLICVFSSSSWATEKPSTVLPPSIAKDQRDYFNFIYELVRRYRGKVRFWQNDSEPNNPIFWNGTREQFVDELRVFGKAVHAADPDTKVVAGGYDGLFNPPGMPPMYNQQKGLEFFDYVIQEAHASFDVFDLRLYADPYTIPVRVDFIRKKLQAVGDDKPIICTEYGGPGIFEFPANGKYASMVVQWSSSLAAGKDPGHFAPIEALYDKMSTLAPQTQMFLIGCPPDLEAKYQRIQGRSLVMRNLLAFSAGVQKAMYWQFAQQEGQERSDLTTLMYGKIGMYGVDVKTGLTHPYPILETYGRMARHLKGVCSVEQVPVPKDPSLFLFRVERTGRYPLWVVWQRRDAFSGEDRPAVSVSVPGLGSAVAEDAFGTTVPVTKGSLPVSLTPIYIESSK